METPCRYASPFPAEMENIPPPINSIDNRPCRVSPSKRHDQKEQSFRSLHSLSYSSQGPIDQDCSGFSTFSFSSRHDNESAAVNFFAKEDFTFVSMTGPMFCSDLKLRDIWSGINSAHYHASIRSWDRSERHMTRLQQVASFADNQTREWEMHKKRLELLSKSFEYTTKAKRAILSSRLKGNGGVYRKQSGNNFTEYSQESNHDMVLTAADSAVSCKHEWSILADLHLATVYARSESFECMLLHKEALKLLDKEMLSLKNSFLLLLKTCEDDNFSAITIDNYSCPRHMVVQYHKRCLFKSIKRLHQSSVDILALCTDISIWISSTMAVWLQENTDVKTAISYAMEVLDRSNDIDSEDSWAESYLLLKSVNEMLSKREDQEEVGTSVSICLFQQYAAAKLEFCFCKKLL